MRQIVDYIVIIFYSFTFRILWHWACPSKFHVRIIQQWDVEVKIQFFTTLTVYYTYIYNSSLHFQNLVHCASTVITSKPLNESFDKFSIVVKHILSARRVSPLSIALHGSCVGMVFLFLFSNVPSKGRFIHLRFRKYLKVQKSTNQMEKKKVYGLRCSGEFVLDPRMYTTRELRVGLIK